MHVTPLQPTLSLSQLAAKTDAAPVEGGGMNRKLKDDSEVATMQAIEPTAAAPEEGLGQNIDTYA